MADPVPTPIDVTNVTVTDPATGETVLADGIAGLVFSDVATLTVAIGQTSYGGPAAGTVYDVSFRENGHTVSLPGLTCQPPAPQYPPWILLQITPPEGGYEITGLNAFDNDAGRYVIKGAVGASTPTGTLYRGGITLVQIKAEGGEIKNGGPVAGHNHSVHFVLNGYALTLSNMMFQGATAEGLFVFQQADD